MPIGWVFFDAGNTLIGLDYTKLRAALWEAGFRVDEAALRRAETVARRDLERTILARWSEGGIPRTGWIEESLSRVFWEQVLRQSGAGTSSGDLVPAVLQVTRPASSWDRLDELTVPTLLDLRSRGCRLGIISNSNGTLAAHLRRLGLAGHFEVILDSAVVGVEKPHREIFEMALREAGGARATESLFVGDLYAIDVLGASSAGLHALLFDPEGRWDPGLAREGAPACRTIRSLAELPRIVEDLPAGG